MPTESVSLGLLSIFSLISFFVILITNNFSSRIGNGVLLDQDFDKPQAFHKQAVARIGGLASIISLIIFFVLYYFLFNQILFDYLFLSVAIFLLGFIEDFKFSIKPKYRLAGMFFILIFFIIFFSIDIGAIDLAFLSSWMKNKLFANLFLLLCFPFGFYEEFS